DDAFYDLKRVEAEMERIFDICHGCRRCFNLCDSFPRLFDMVDEGPTGDVDFAHLMLRHRAALRKANGGDFVREQLGETDRNGKLAKPVAPIANWASK